METKILDLGAINGQVSVQIIRKKIKNVHLKVFRSLEVILSVPLTVPNDWIDSFLNDHIKWIDSQITKYKKSSGYNNLSNIRSGSSTQLLGKDVRIYKEASLSNRVELDEKKVCIFLKDTSDEELAQRLFDEWWRNTASDIFQSETEQLYQKIFKKYGLNQPKILVRKMKTLWGSCTPSKDKITLNEYLLKADIRCIQYVILHELTHLIYPNHSKEFYDFLTIHMPDWKERKKQLDNEVVQGL
jgi:predicted metal-dependent hydrolase